MSYKITCESSADLNQDTYKKLGIPVMPFNITLGDKTFKDFEVSTEELFDYADKNKTLPVTSAFNEYDYDEFFKKENTEDGLIHFCIGSKISSTYNNALKAAENHKNVYVIDSMSLSSGMGLEVLFAIELRKNGTPIEKAVEIINNRRDSVQISFVIDNLTYLHKGGRCSTLSMLGANLLKLRPSILLSNGRMVVGKKYSGKMHSVVAKYITDTLNEFNNPDPKLCFITYSTATPEMLSTAHNTLEEYGKFKKIEETRTGCTVSTHCGPNTLGVIYYNDGGNYQK